MDGLVGRIAAHRVVLVSLNGRRREGKDLARGLLPELETEQFARHLGVAVDGQVDVGLIRFPVERVLRFAYHLAVAEDGDDIFAVGVVGLGAVAFAEQHLSAERHRVVVRTRVDISPRAPGVDRIFDDERLAEAVLVGHVDLVVVHAHRQVGGEVQTDLFLFQGAHRT